MIEKGHTKQLLGNGYLKLIDWMGTDETIVEAARMSTGKGFISWEGYSRCDSCGFTVYNKEMVNEGRLANDCQNHKMVEKLDGDAGFLEFLLMNNHSTPFEMCELAIEVQAPIFVFREWHRHRTQCLAGDTEVYFEIRHRAKDAKRGPYKVKIKDLYARWQPSVRKDRPERQTNAFFKKQRVQQMLLRCLNEDSKAFINTNIVDVLYSGKKETYEVILGDGKKITCSPDHRFLFKNGWASLKEGVGLTHNGGTVAWSDDAALYVNGVEAYRDAEWLKTRYHSGMTLDVIASEAGVSTHAIRKWLKKHNLQMKKDFQKGHLPWNTGKTYKTGAILSEEHKEKIRHSRSGEKSNFWKGGVSSDRANIARWTREQAPKVHEKFDYTCQLCKKRGGRLHAYHVIPVWADEAKAYDFENLVSLCEDCHHDTKGKELDFVPRLTGLPLPEKYNGKSPHTTKGQPKLIAKLVRIKDIKYVGEQDCYDLAVEGPFHNFVANGIVTHNSYNEFSARYSVMPNEHYVPEKSRFAPVKSSNKQEASVSEKSEVNLDDLVAEIVEDQRDTYARYEELISEGVPKEIARINCPVSRLSKMRAKTDLLNWLKFLNLRMRPNAMWEIRQYANAVAAIIEELFPRTYYLFEEWMLFSQSFGRTEMKVLKKLFISYSEAPDMLAQSAGMDEKHRKAFLAKLGRV